MSKKVKVLISIVVTVVLLTAGGAATVMAQDEAAPPATGFNGLLARVAEILGISEEDLGNAFKQAEQEMGQEAFTQALDKAVEKGLITQEEAEAIQAWWQQRPEAVNRLIPHILPFMLPQAQRMPDGKLAKAVERGLITQDEAEAIQAWWQQRPEAFNQLLPRILRFMVPHAPGMPGGKWQMKPEMMPPPGVTPPVAPPPLWHGRHGSWRHPGP